MNVSVSTTIGQETIQHFVGLASKELAARLDPEKLVADATDEQDKFAAWMRLNNWNHLQDAVAEHACDFLKTDLVGVFAGAWTNYAELKKAALDTTHDATLTAEVTLAEHAFTYELAPNIDVMLNGAKMATIPLRFAMVCIVKGLCLVLKAGSVTAVRAGECECAAHLRIAGAAVWDKQLLAVDLPGKLKLTQPIPLPISSHA